MAMPRESSVLPGPLHRAHSHSYEKGPLHFGKARLYSDMHTVSCWWMGPSKMHFM